MMKGLGGMAVGLERNLSAARNQLSQAGDLPRQVGVRAAATP